MNPGEERLVAAHMTPSVISVTERTRVGSVLDTLLALDVSCVLVTSMDGVAPVGVVSMSDLARLARFEDGARGPLYLLPPELDARDVMTPHVFGVDAEATVGEAAAIMLRHRVHRLFVHRGPRVVGVFSTRDALRVVMAMRITRPLRSVMSAPVRTIAIGDPIDAALAELEQADVRGLVVVEDSHPIGIFTELEAIRARALPAEVRANPVEEVMSYEAISLDAETPLYRAAGRAIAMRTRRIMVVDGRALVGIVTGYDLAQVLAQTSD